MFGGHGRCIPHPLTAEVVGGASPAVARFAFRFQGLPFELCKLCFELCLNYENRFDLCLSYGNSV